MPGLWTITSNQAVVNARVVTLSSPIEGVVTTAPPATGKQVARGALLLQVDSPLVDEKHVEDLQTEMATLFERVAALKKHLARIEALKAELSVSFDNYKNSMVTKVAHELEEAKAEEEAAAAALRQKVFEEGREFALLNRGFGRPPELTAARYAAEVAAKQAARARASVARLTHQLESIKCVVFIGPGDSRNDVPYSRQRVDELAVQQLDDEAKIQEHEARLAQLERQVGSESSRSRQRSSYQLTAPVDGIVWRRFVAEGSSVGPQTELLQILDTSTLFVDARLSEKYADDVRPGNKVVVRLTGSAIEVSGTIRHVLGEGVPQEDHTRAAELPKPSGHEIHVIVDFDKAAAGAGEFNQCLVGRRVEVHFPDVARSRFRLRKARA
jgi:multidrug resistance efflux pump